MKPLLPLAVASVLSPPLFAGTPETADVAPVQAMGAYVPTDDMAESETFYRAMFDADPVIGLPDFVAFDVAGGWFAIVSRDKYAQGSVPGRGAVPYMQTVDLVVIQSRLAATGAQVPEIIKEPGIHLLKITDPNGQLIEFFKLTGQ